MDSDTANAIIAGLALITSTISVFFTRASIMAQERHNRLSVRPIPYVAENFLPNPDRLAVDLQNNGVGPIRIIRCTVVDATDPGIHADNLHSLMPDLPPGIEWENYVALIGDRWLKTESMLRLIELTDQERRWSGDKRKSYLDFRQRVAARLSTLTVKIEYTDVYGTKFEPYEKSLAWFAKFGAQVS